MAFRRFICLTASLMLFAMIGFTAAAKERTIVGEKWLSGCPDMSLWPKKRSMSEPDQTENIPLPGSLKKDTCQSKS